MNNNGTLKESGTLRKKETLKENFSIATKILSVTSRIIFLLGAAIVFLYCFFTINYFPSGLSFGDTLFFAFIAFGFAIIYLMLFLFPSVTFYLLKYPWCDGKKDKYKWLIFLPGFFLLLLAILTLCLFIKNFNIVNLIYITSFVVCSIVFIVMTTKKNLKIERRVVSCVTLLFFPLLTIQGLYSKLSSVSLENLGISNRSASVSFSNEQYSVIKKMIEERGGYAFENCSREQNNTLHNVRVLWNGIGEYIYLEIPYLHEGDKNTNINKIRLDLKKDQVNIFKNYQNDQAITYYGCVYQRVGKLFKAGESELEENKIVQIENITKRIDKVEKSYKIKEIRLYGTADATEYKGNSNLKLSELRGESVRRKFEKDGKYTNLIKVEGLSNSELKTSCDDKQLSKSDLADCRAEDRGVLVQIVVDKYKEKSEENEEKSEKKN